MFTITPDSGFSISQVLVDGVDQGAVSTYTFTNVVTAHTISATFVLGGGGGTQTTTLDMGDSEWFDARLGASGPWGTFSIYANGVLIGTKTADGTSTWNCPQTDVPSGARIDIVADVGFTDPLEVYDYYTPHTFTTYLPAGVTRLEAATWSGFPLLTSGDGADGYNWGYPENDYTYVYLAPATITGIVYSTGGPVTNYTLTYTAGANGTITRHEPSDGRIRRFRHRGHGGGQHRLPLRELVRRHHDCDTYRHQRDGQQERDRELRDQHLHAHLHRRGQRHHHGHEPADGRITEAPAPRSRRWPTPATTS